MFCWDPLQFLFPLFALTEGLTAGELSITIHTDIIPLTGAYDSDCHPLLKGEVHGLLGVDR